MSEQQNEQPAGEHVAVSAEQQPAQPVQHVQPEPPAQTVEGTPATPDPTFGTPAVDDPDLDPETVQPEPAGGADPDADADEPNADERELAGDGDVTQPHPYVPGFGVSGKFQTPGAQDAGDDAEGDRA